MGLVPDISVITERLGDIEGLHMKSNLRNFYETHHRMLFARDAVHYVD